MLDLLCRKSGCGDLDVSLARRHLACHEWGRARLALEKGLAKGRLSEPEQARTLLQEVRDRMGCAVALNGAIATRTGNPVTGARRQPADGGRSE